MSLPDFNKEAPRVTGDMVPDLTTNGKKSAHENYLELLDYLHEKERRRQAGIPDIPVESWLRSGLNSLAAKPIFLSGIKFYRTLRKVQATRARQT